MKWRVYLELGRVSNLPTVWTNTLAGIVLATAARDSYDHEEAAIPSWGRIALFLVAFSAFYIGGMFLNDAFDRAIDARERPGRPIASGRISLGEVQSIGYGLLILGVALVAVDSFVLGGTGGVLAVVSAVGLGGVIVLYDAWHKGNPLSPLLMGACRVLVYVTVAIALTGRVSGTLWIGAGMLLSHLIGLTFLAKHEGASLRAATPPSALAWGRLWPLALLFAPILLLLPQVFASPSLAKALFLGGYAGWIVLTLRRLRGGAKGAIPRAVVALIAGISLLDANLILVHGGSALAVVAVGGFATTLWLQRFVSGT